MVEVYRHTAVAQTSPRLKFWDEIEEFPAVHLNAEVSQGNIKQAGLKIDF